MTQICCNECQGRGALIRMTARGQQIAFTCHKCGGTGIINVQENPINRINAFIDDAYKKKVV